MNSSKTRKVTFYKMHSLGNDFMVIDQVSQSIPMPAHQIQAWGDRQRGIGFDQLLMIEPPTEPEADFYYRIYNADGTEAEQCGNGTRCVSMLARHLGLTKRTSLTWQSAAGTLHTESDGEDQYRSTLTVPELGHEHIPFDPQHAVAEQDGIRYQLSSGSETFTVTPVSMGNPHAVIFVEDVISLDVERIGRLLTEHPAFPQRVNVGFCQIVDEQFVRLRVYERGVGETQACGSGACAAIVDARLNQLVGTKVKVSLPGGKLRIAWPAIDQPVTMSGPATLVFRGETEMESHAD